MDIHLTIYLVGCLVNLIFITTFTVIDRIRSKNFKPPKLKNLHKIILSALLILTLSWLYWVMVLGIEIEKRY